MEALVAHIISPVLSNIQMHYEQLLISGFTVPHSSRIFPSNLLPLDNFREVLLLADVLGDAIVFFRVL